MPHVLVPFEIDGLQTPHALLSFAPSYRRPSRLRAALCRSSAVLSQRLTPHPPLVVPPPPAGMQLRLTGETAPLQRSSPTSITTTHTACPAMRRPQCTSACPRCSTWQSTAGSGKHSVSGGLSNCCVPHNPTVGRGGLPPYILEVSAGQLHYSMDPLDVAHCMFVWRLEA
jgi:hypothetical protein